MTFDMESDIFVSARGKYITFAFMTIESSQSMKSIVCKACRSGQMGVKMKNNKQKTWLLIGTGVLVILLMAASSLYSVKYNEARLVEPMDFSQYVFRMKDLPMIVSGVLFCIYIGCLIVLIIRTASRNAREVEETHTTRRISPKFGFFGFFGFLGFLGFWTYSARGDIFPVFFFLFFGFFGFFYEGKMSHTFMDERYQENAKRAQHGALKIAFGVMVAALVVLCYGGRLRKDPGIIMLSAASLLALGVGLVLFLSQYLLYRYDREDSCPKGEEDENA